MTRKTFFFLQAGLGWVVRKNSTLLAFQTWREKKTVTFVLIIPTSNQQQQGNSPQERLGVGLVWQHNKHDQAKQGHVWIGSHCNVTDFNSTVNMYICISAKGLVYNVTLCRSLAGQRL